MRRRTFLTMAGGAVFGVGVAQVLADGKTIKKPKEKSKSEEKAPAEVVITKQVREYNSREYAGPPNQFHPGHVKPWKLSKKRLKKTDNGFTIQLPSKAPVPTPAVYQDKAYVSGGFYSKEFYCFGAKTGRLAWGLELDDNGLSAAAVEDGVVVYNTESCTIFAHEAETGKLLWSWWLGDPLMSSPTIANGKVFTSYPASGRVAGGQLNFIDVPVQQQSIQQIASPSGAVRRARSKKPGDKPRPPQSHVLVCFELKTVKLLWQR